MKSDFMLAITQLSAEKNLSKEVVLGAVEAALVSAYRKDNFAPNQNISVKIHPTNGTVHVWAEKEVVEKPADTRCQIDLAEAVKIKPDVEIGEVLMVEATPHNAGRIAAQTAKQVILQRLHEAEHSAIFEEYAGREGDIVTGIVQRIESRQILVDLGRTEAILPAAEQVPIERYRVGQRIKAIVLEVVRTNKEPRVILSRSHPDLLQRLFEIEVPEIFNKTIELRSIAREAGSRSKVAVMALQEGVDPVGCCVGLRGIRIQNIVNELNGEKIDVVLYSPDATTFIANALSPAHILSVEMDKKEGLATVIVPDRQLSLAIGKEGQNVRLAAKLTGWRIDIKSASVAEAEKVEAEKVEIPEKTIKVEPPEEILIGEEILEETPVQEEPEEAPEEEEAEMLPSFDAEFVPPVPVEEVLVTEEKPLIRFAEDILPRSPAKTKTKSKKKKKKDYQDDERNEEEGIIVRKSRRDVDISLDDDEDY